MKNAKQAVILGLIMGLAVLGYMSIRSKQSQQESQQNVIQAKDNLAKAGIKVVEAHLNLYYVVNNKYPLNWESLEEFVENRNDDRLYLEELQKVINKFNNFSYEVRGDREAYKIIYTDEKGDKIEIEGNYNQDFH